MRGVAGLVAITALVSVRPRIAEACSLPPCGRGYIVPATGSTVPASTPAISWRSQSDHGMSNPRDPALVKITTTADPDTPLPFTATVVRSTNLYAEYTLVPDQPLVAGTSYTVTDGNVCQQASMLQGPTSTFSVGPAAPLPAQLGTLTRTPAELRVLEIWTISGSCTSPVDAMSVDVQLALSAEAMPWRDALHFETLVDGQPWTKGGLSDDWRPPGTNGQGRGKDMVFRVCHTDDPGVSHGLDGGVHIVTMRATLPGTSVMLETAPVSVQLECPPSPRDLSVPDAGTSDPEPTGCGCATNDTSSIASFLLALAVSLRLARRRI